MSRKKEDIQHGTTGGYVSHRRRKETPCPDCRLVWRDYYRAHRVKSNEEKAKKREHIQELAQRLGANGNTND